MMFVSFNSDMTDATCGTGSAYPSGEPEYIPGFRGVPVARSLLYKVMFVLLSSFFWSVCCSSLTNVF